MINNKLKQQLEQPRQTIDSHPSLACNLTKAVLMKAFIMFRCALRRSLTMLNTLTRKHIVVSPENYDLIKNYARASDSFNDAITELLRIASREGGNPHRGII